MAVLALTDCAAYVGGYDFTTDTNEARLSFESASKDKTTFGSGGYTELVGGLKTVSCELKGFWQSATSQAVDPESFPDLGIADRVHTFAPVEVAPPDPAPFNGESVAYFFQGGKFNYSIFGEIGEVTPFTLSSMGTNGTGAVRGILTAPRGNVSATGKLGATWDTLGFGIAAGQFLFAVVHVFTAGTTITLQLQSDDNTGFTTPTTLVTVGPLTASGGTWVTPVAGPLTDRYYRLNVSAITGTFNVAAAIGNR